MPKREGTTGRGGLPDFTSVGPGGLIGRDILQGDKQAGHV